MTLAIKYRQSLQMHASIGEAIVMFGCINPMKFLPILEYDLKVFFIIMVIEQSFRLSDLTGKRFA